MVVFLLAIIVYRSVIDPIPTYLFDLHQRMDRHHIRAREDHFHTEQLQTRPNLYAFARYPRGIYPQRGISCVRCCIWGDQPGAAESEIGPEKFLEQNCDTRQQHTSSFKFNISLSNYTYVRFLLNLGLDVQTTRRDMPWNARFHLYFWSAPHRYNDAKIFFLIEHERFTFVIEWQCAPSLPAA